MDGFSITFAYKPEGLRSARLLALGDALQIECTSAGGLTVALQRLVLDPVLGISDPRTDQRIAFVGGIRGTDELETRAADCHSWSPTPRLQTWAAESSAAALGPSLGYRRASARCTRRRSRRST